MALPSQTSRAETWRSSSSSGSSPLAGVFAFARRNRPLVFGVAAAAAVVGGWVYFTRAGGPQQVTADTPAPGDTFLPTAPVPQKDQAAAPQAPKPTSISMGMLNEPTAPPSKPMASTSLDELIAQSGTPGVTPGGQPGAATPPTPTPSPTPTPTPTPTGAQPPADTTGTPAGSAEAGSEGRGVIEQANQLIQQNRPLEARKLLNDALLNASLSSDARGAVRSQLTTINETLFFSPTVVKGDTLTDEHTVTSGETLGRIVRKEGLPIDWRLLVRINRMPSENALRIGQKLKVVRQPLHAVVHKDAYRMDIYAGAPASPGATTGPDGQDPSWTYIRSFRVGLGESNGTPEGTFVVRANSKLVNPKWVNPRTAEVFLPDDPNNPIGERWIGLDGIDDSTRRFTGYGVHGTIDIDSIGQQKSMGCVRLGPADIEMVYEMLVERISTVRIVR